MDTRPSIVKLVLLGVAVVAFLILAFLAGGATYLLVGLIAMIVGIVIGWTRALA